MIHQVMSELRPKNAPKLSKFRNNTVKRCSLWLMDGTKPVQRLWLDYGQTMVLQLIKPYGIDISNQLPWFINQPLTGGHHLAVFDAFFLRKQWCGHGPISVETVLGFSTPKTGDWSRAISLIQHGLENPPSMDFFFNCKPFDNSLWGSPLCHVIFSERIGPHLGQ